MRRADDLLREIELAFPAVSKPSAEALYTHPRGCPECDYLRRKLAKYKTSTLPDEALRILYNDLSSLSANGWRWVLPSLLRRCVTQSPSTDALETEFLIYHLAPGSQSEHYVQARLSTFSPKQLTCLQHFLSWCERHPYWSEYCPSEISQAIAFLTPLVEPNNAT